MMVSTPLIQRAPPLIHKIHKPHARRMQLAEEDAWVMATAWRDELRYHVQLAMDPTAARSFNVVKSYEWIQVDFHDRNDTKETRLRLAAAVRASCEVWSALARSRGYSGLENPSFWRRVFESFDPPAVVSASLPSSGAFGFFDRDPEHTFPRLLAVVDNESVDQVESILSVICGLESYAEEEEEWRARLDSILSQLKPFCQNLESPLSLPLAVQVESPLHTVQLVETVERVTTSSGADVRFQKLVVADWQWHLAEASVDSAVMLLRMPQISLPRLSLPPLFEHRENLPSVLQSIFGVDSSMTVMPHQTTQLIVNRAKHDDKEMRAILSTLPTSRHFDSLVFESARTTHDLTDFDWAWLGYAIFHPDAETSAWRQLTLTIEGIGNAKVENFTRMARGNNLLAALPGNWASYPRTSDAYHTATLGQETAVFRKADSQAHEAVMHLPAHSTVDVCVPSCDVASFPDRVCVVVPGLGLGWIDKQAIVKVDTRSAAVAALTQLQVNMVGSSQPILEPLVEVLRVVGSNLESLNIQRCGFAQPQVLLNLLSCCPKLTSLSASHDGSLWSDDSILKPEDLAAMPKLKELELAATRDHSSYIQPSQWALDTVLHDLQALRLLNTSGSVQAMGNLLSQHYGLRYFHYHKTTHDGRLAPSDRTHDPTQDAINKLLEETEGNSVERMTHALGPFPVRQRAAFLSVVQKISEETPGNDDANTSALGSLDPDILERVFSFASMPTKRQLCFDGEFPYNREE